MADNFLMLREVYPGLWLYKTRLGNYGIKEGDTGYSTCGSMEDALDYAQKIWQKPKEHSDSLDCWCSPVVEYEDDGARLIVHRGLQ